ncbi:MAG TPA: DUF4386 domain-containing protein [Rhizomicrobium sp.]|jgi:hypothetical protein|nr:DUF4386 domain-containing protein [Rhizomicrobium sp.]
MQAVERTQIAYARLAGFVYLLLIVLFMGGAFLIAHIAGRGDFAATSANILASMHLYRGALVLQILASILTTLLAYALYVVVRPVDTNLAQMALCWRLGEAFVGTAFAWVSYLELGLYATGLDAAQARPWLALAHMIDAAGFNITTLTFSFGSTIFFYLFFKSACIPRAIAGFGIFASVVVAVVSVSNLVLPEYAASLQIAWLPIFAAEIVTGFWLLFGGVRVQAAVRHDVSGMA